MISELQTFGKFPNIFAWVAPSADASRWHGLRRSFASLCEWIEVPAGIDAQIQEHKPQGVREQHYIRRPLDLLWMWHVKIEAWILEQAEVEFVPVQAGLRVVKSQ